jgi:hypothetical protein
VGREGGDVEQDGGYGSFTTRIPNLYNIYPKTSFSCPMMFFFKRTPLRADD